MVWLHASELFEELFDMGLTTSSQIERAYQEDRHLMMRLIACYAKMEGLALHLWSNMGQVLSASENIAPCLIRRRVIRFPLPADYEIILIHCRLRLACPTSAWISHRPARPPMKCSMIWRSSLYGYARSPSSLHDENDRAPGHRGQRAPSIPPLREAHENASTTPL